MEFNLSDIINKNITSLLIEGRLENVKAKYPRAGSMVDWLSENDPSGNNKYLSWMAKQALYSDQELIQTFGNDDWYLTRYGRNWKVDKDELVDLIKYFHQYPHKYEKKDINQYKTLKELEDATEIARTKLSRKELKDQGGEKVYEDDNFILIHPKTHEASCKYGSRTRWCVTMRGYTGYFERYSINGPLFFLIDKRRMPVQDSPQYMRKAPDYYKIALHYQPRIGGRIMTDKSDFVRKAKNLSREEFINSANRDNVSLDFWNVQDANVSENVVLKFLGGPGRGQKVRGTEALNNFKTAMENYTKKLLGDFWDKVHSENTVDIEGKKQEINEKIRKLARKRDYYRDVHERLDNTIYYLDQLKDDDLKQAYNVTDEEDLIPMDFSIDVTEEKLEQLVNKREQINDAAMELERQMSELHLELRNLESKTKHEFAFYDLANNVPQG